MNLRLRQLRDEAAAALRDAGIEDASADARRILEEATGLEPAELTAALDDPATERTVALVDRMVARRSHREPLQYVLGRWGFRTLDLLVDERVLIPRPETEVVAGYALEALEERLREPRAPGHGPGERPVAVDLGTGSGAIALSLAAETWPRVEVWATDVSVDALAVASANLAGLGRRASTVHLAEGDWFAPLPEELRGRVDVVVSNPPYVGADEPLPPEVAEWEPAGALVAGPTGREAIERILADAPGWLRPDGVVVLEIGETQGDAVRRAALDLGYGDVEVRPDLTGRDRALVARAPR